MVCDANLGVNNLTLSTPPIYKQNECINIAPNPIYKVLLAYGVNGHIYVSGWLSVNFVHNYCFGNASLLPLALWI